MPSTSSRVRVSNLDAPMGPTLSPKFRSRPRISLIDSERLFLQQLACRQQGAALLAGQRLYVHRPEQVDAHHLRNAACVIPVALVDLRLEEGFRVPRLDAHHR